MKRNVLFAKLMAVVFVTLVASAAAHANSRSCSPEGVAGKWGYTYTGTIILSTGAIPTAAVGRFTLDEEGNISGTQTRSVGGSIAEETLKGTGTVNADCTAKYKVDVYDASGNLARSAVLAGVFVDKARELRLIFASLVLPNGASIPTVITVNARKLFHEEGEED